MKTLVIDLDGTLTLDEKDVAYEDKKPNLALIEKLKIYHKKGFKITIFTSRGMRTYAADADRIALELTPVIVSWLKKHSVPYDELLVGKPWCGFEGFYVDDRAVRPSEFVAFEYEEIIERLEKEHPYREMEK